MKFINIFIVTHSLQRQISGKMQTTDILRNFQNISWCKPDWYFPSMGTDTNELLHQCANISSDEVRVTVDDIIRKSKEFSLPFPVETPRMQYLKDKRSLERLKGNIASTYPLIHERVLLLITHFLIHKREYGTTIEKAVYRDMTIAQFIDRILTKRSGAFLGSRDHYKLLSGEEGYGGWEQVGTLQQKPPLLLEDCLSYDEMKIASMVYVSGETECINDGERHNNGVYTDDDTIEQHAVIIGIVGPRFARNGRMEYEDVIVSPRQNTWENGYGEQAAPATCLGTLRTAYGRTGHARRAIATLWPEFYQVRKPGGSVLILTGIIGPRFEKEGLMEYEDVIVSPRQNTWENGYGEQAAPATCLGTLRTAYGRTGLARRAIATLWPEFYQVHSVTYDELISSTKIPSHPGPLDRYVKQVIRNHNTIEEAYFDNEVYYKRLTITIECALLEANYRGQVANKKAFLNVIGAGLGVWRISNHQTDIYVLTVLERVRALLKKDLLNYVTDVNMAFIKPSDEIGALFSNKTSPTESPTEKRIFFESKRHPNGGINVQLESRQPSAKLLGEHAGKLLVLTYAWDGNAHPGNEFWLGSTSGSGDPAAACSTQVAELHNAHINTGLTGNRARVVGARIGGMTNLHSACQIHLADNTDS